MQGNIGEIHHVGYLVRNIDKTISLYEQLGFELIVEKKYYEMNDFYDDVNKILEFIKKQNRLNAIIINTERWIKLWKLEN